MNLNDIDAIELAEALDWIAQFFTQADPATPDRFNTWAINTTAVPDLINDLHRWTHQLTTNPTP